MSNSSRWIACRRLHLARRHPRRPSKRFSLRLHWLNRRKRTTDKDETAALGGKREMRIMNQKLYVKNQMMIEENKKLRNRVAFLRQENQFLSSELLQVPRKQPQPSPHIFSVSSSNP